MISQQKAGKPGKQHKKNTNAVQRGRFFAVAHGPHLISMVGFSLFFVKSVCTHSANFLFPRMVIGVGNTVRMISHAQQYQFSPSQKLCDGLKNLHYRPKSST